MEIDKEVLAVKNIREAESKLNEVLLQAAENGIEVLHIDEMSLRVMGDRFRRVQIYIKIAKIL